MTPLRIIFAGTPDFAARHLQALIDCPHQIVGVYSQPDRPAGRGKKLQASPVKQLALDASIPVFQPDNFKDAAHIDELAALEADLMVVVAYGLLLPKAVLEAPKLGCINVHGSVLPKWRGAAPIQRAIWAGDKVSGVTIMQMDEGLDTGDMLLIDETPIASDETSHSLYEKLAQSGPKALLTALERISQNSIHPVVQDDSQASYAKKLSKAEAQIDWQQSADFIERCVRAFNPWPISYFVHQGANIKVWQAEVVPLNDQVTPGTILSADKEGIVVTTGKNALRLMSLQLPGKKALNTADILNARRDWFEAGTQLS